MGASNLEPLIKGKTPDFVKENEKFQETLKVSIKNLGPNLFTHFMLLPAKQYPCRVPTQVEEML